LQALDNCPATTGYTLTTPGPRPTTQGRIRVTRTTGHAFYTEVYRRQYELEVLAVDDGKVMFHVTSDDIVPRGYLHGGSDKQFGSVTVEIRDTLEATVKEAIERPAVLQPLPGDEGGCGMKIIHSGGAGQLTPTPPPPLFATP
jgi:hypothetical protein